MPRQGWPKVKPGIKSEAAISANQWLRTLLALTSAAVLTVGASSLRADDADYPHAPPDEPPVAPEAPPPGGESIGGTPASNLDMSAPAPEPTLPAVAPAVPLPPEASAPQTGTPAPPAAAGAGVPPSGPFAPGNNLLSQPAQTESTGAPAPEPAPEAEGSNSQEAAPLQPVENETVSAAASDESDESVFSERDLRIPRFTNLRPAWAFQFAFSGNGLGGSTFSDGANFTTVRGVLINFEYQPRFLQTMGVFGIGPLIGYYPVIPRYTDILPLAAVWSAGVQFRYQARFFREQPVVPYVGLAAEDLQYHLSTAGMENVMLVGPVLGAEVLLNVFEPSSAFDFYANFGVLRSYLVAEIRSLSGNTTDLSVSGTSYFFGLRIEF